MPLYAGTPMLENIPKALEGEKKSTVFDRGKYKTWETFRYLSLIARAD